MAAGRKGGIQTQRLSRLAVSTSTMTLRGKENVETLPTTSQKTRSPWLSRLAARSVFFEFVEEVDGVAAAFAARAGARFHAEAFVDLVAGDKFGHAGEEVAFHADVDV